MEEQSTVLMLAAFRDAYSVRDIKHTMTVGELRGFLEDFNDDTPIYLSHDRGYTYGAVTAHRFEEEDV